MINGKPAVNGALPQYRVYVYLIKRWFLQVYLCGPLPCRCPTRAGQAAVANFVSTGIGVRRAALYGGTFQLTTESPDCY